MTKKQDMKKTYLFVSVLFFLSGVSGLIYQIVWTRKLVLIFGNTMLATSTVLSAFMAGLAAGSYIFGRYADKRPRGLIRLYALLEGGIGIYALLFPLLLSIAGPVYTGLYRALAGNILVLNLFRFVICFALIVIPTFLMGATLPILLKRFVKGTRTIGSQMGLLYGLNTAGAVVGSLVCGFLFLRLFGMRLSTLAAVAINFLVAILAWILGKDGAEVPENGPPTGQTPGDKPVEAPAREYSPATVRLVLLGIGISGFCALAYEVFWTRMLNLFFHNTVYSFTTILATFLMGIAVGSLVYAKFLSRIVNKVVFFIFIEAGIGVLAYATPYIFNLLYDPIFSQSAQTFTILKAAAIMLGPTILMGISLPLAVQICQRGPRHEGGSVGTVYAVNTVGSILGAFAAGFLLLPHLGIHTSVMVTVSLNIGAGLLVLLAGARKPLRWVYGVSFACILLLSFLLAPTALFRNLYTKKEAAAQIMYYKEGKVANVVVYDFYKSGYRDLYLNGIEEASSRLWHVQLFKMLGVLPTVVHPQPDDALMIAFGAGMSAGACIDRVNYFECAELNPDIFEEAGFFKKENLAVADNPKLNMIFNDGRNHLLLTPRKYSLIISDATNPLTFDSWTLYTKEFYQLCKQKLKPGGVFCQWVPIPLPGDAIKVILKTFQSVFPHTSFWVIYGSSQCLMLATPERLEIDYRDLCRKLPPILKTTGLADYGVDSVDKFLSFFLLGEDRLKQYLEGFHKINSDDLPDAQFHAGLNQEGIQTGLELLKYQETIEPYLTNITGTGEEKAAVRESLENYLSVSRLLNLGFLTDKGLEYKKASAFAAGVNLSGDKNILCMLQYGPKRKEYFLERAASYPGDSNAHNTLGFIYRQEGNYQKAIAEFKRAVALKPDFANARVNLAQTYIEASMFDAGVEELLTVTRLNPTADVFNMARNELEIVHLTRKLRYHKDDPVLFVKLANAYLTKGEIYRAIKSFQAAAALKNDDRDILTSLARLHETVEQWDRALWIYKRLGNLFPGDENVTGKIEQLEAIRTDPGVREKWMSGRITSAGKPPDHPEGCLHALEKWTKFDFDGKVSARNLEGAAAEFEKVIGENPQHMHAYADAATIYENLKRYSKAADLWSRGLRVSPGNQMAANNIRRLELLEELHYRKPDPQRRIQLHNEIGVLYWGNGEIERAAQYFEEVIREKPAHAMAWANLGANYIQSGKYKKAALAIKHALELDPAIQYSEQMKERLRWLREVIGPGKKDSIRREGKTILKK